MADPTVQTPEDPELDQAMDLIRNGRAEDGADILEHLLAACPDKYDVVGYLAFTSLHLRRWSRASELYDRLARLAGGQLGWKETYYHAWALAAQGVFTAAMALCERAATLSGGNPRPHELGAVCALRSGQPARALEFLQPLVGTAVPLDSPFTLLELKKNPAKLRQHVVSIWYVAAFLVRCEKSAGRMPADRIHLSTRLSSYAARTARAVGRRTSHAAGVDRLLWWAWQFNHGLRGGMPVEDTAPDEDAVRAYREVLDAVLDELLQIPLCRIATVLSASIRAQDALALYSWTRKNRPASSVHVGTFIGVSACLWAVALRDAGSRGAIHTVDPHLIISYLDPESLFQRVACRLGIRDLITVHHGFFNHVLPGVEEGAGERMRPPVIGRQLLESLPPVDAFVVDGDHSSMGVTADLLLALEFLAPGGSVLLHDVRSLRGVRRGVGQFFHWSKTEGVLEYRELAPASLDGLGVISRRGSGDSSNAAKG